MRKMEKNRPAKKNKGGRPQGTTTEKLDFLLDTVDTEVANLAETMVTQGPIVHEATSSDEDPAIGLNHETTVADHLDLDMAMFGDSDESLFDMESLEVKTEAALGALMDAESEVEAMLTPPEMETETENAAVAATDQEAKEQPAVKTLAQLLATSETDDFELSEKAEQQEQAAAKPPGVNDKLSEDRFSDLNTTSAESEGDALPTSKPPPPTPSDEELATLMSHKVEALLTRLVEERLPVIAEQIISEKLNKIIGSMK
jgi:hypothetical protein